MALEMQSSVQRTRTRDGASRINFSLSAGALTLVGLGDVGGTVLTDSLGRNYHGDHAYVFYQKPVDARRYPLVFAHGVGQFSKTWETTPDCFSARCGKSCSA